MVVAIPKGDDDLFDHLVGYIEVFTGSENDVISRYYKCAKHLEIDPIIRVCGDAKNVKAEQVLQQLENYKKYGFSYGNFCEVFSFNELEHYYKNDRRPEVREHVVHGMIHDRCVNLEMDLDN